MLVLGIESSCDETGLAFYHSEKGLLAHVLHSQIATHRVFGGVVPELASREHVTYLVPLLDELLKKANCKKNDIEAIAYTSGPGLVGALLVGASFAKSLAFALNIPALAVHHLEAHVLVAQLDAPLLQFPFTALLVSGGHTQLIAAHALGNYQLLGETLDDAVGEAFDKTAKLMGFDYPGGPLLAALADEAANTSDLPMIVSFPRPMLDSAGFEFSFSGLKTHTRLVWEKSKQTQRDKMAIAAAFQAAVIETLRVKTRRAMEATGSRRLVIAGGVGANLALRAALKTDMDALSAEVYFPRLEYCTDNGAMVAYAGYLHLIQGARDKNHAIQVHARMPFIEMTS